MAYGTTETRWFPQHQPQTLQIAVALLYWNAFLGLLFSVLEHSNIDPKYLLVIVADVAGGLGIANDRKWGYIVAIAAAVATIALFFADNQAVGGVLNLIFEIALVVLLVHPMSRSYYKIWFR